MSKILWLEDEPKRLWYIPEYIKRNLPKTQILIAQNLKEFFEELKRNPEEIDLLIIDLILRTVSSEELRGYLGKGGIEPERIGVEVIRKILKENYKIPVLVLTVMSESTQTGVAIFQEIDELSEKAPFEIEVIKKEVSLREITEKICKHIHCKREKGRHA